MYKLLFILLIFTSHILGTGQAPDYVYIDFIQHALYTNPLEEYFNKYPDKLPRNDILSTACMRGYVATFEIKEEKFYIKNIRVTRSPNPKKYDAVYKTVTVIDEVFPNEPDRFLAWYSGNLIVPYGEIVDYVHIGYLSTYAKYYIIKIINGFMVSKIDLSYSEFEKFKANQFAKYKKTDEYKKLFNKIYKDWGFSFYKKKKVEKHIKKYLTDYIAKIFGE